MAECLFQRARSPEQKAERRAQILAAAATFFEQERFEAISLASIARKAGVTKAALYRYFSSKEALFLGLYLDELEQVSLTPVDDTLPLWQALSDLLVARPLFCRLTAILHSVLEQNLDEAAALQFKQSLLSHFAVLAQRLQQAYGLSGDQAATYLMQVQQSLIGCWAVSHPAPVVDKILEAPELALFRVDFQTALQAQFKALEMVL